MKFNNYNIPYLGKGGYREKQITLLPRKERLHEGNQVISLNRRDG